MGGMVKSAGGFLGLSGGPQAPGVENGNTSLTGLNDQNSLYGDVNQLGLLNDYALGDKSSADLLSQPATSFANQGRREELGNALATGATTGSKYATEQVQNNPILGSLFGANGELGKQEGILDKLQSQGFQLTPEDQTLYGQASGNIARMFGAQGNQISQDLASRGLSSAPSGSAGAMFSGLAGNQNEMLAQAQQQIMQQRFQNTMQQIGQQQNFINALGQQGENAINQQYGRQLSGAQAQKQGLASAAQLQGGQNANTNQANMAAANFNVENTPGNIADAGISNFTQGSAAKAGAAGKNQGQSAPTGGMAGMAALFGA